MKKPVWLLAAALVCACLAGCGGQSQAQEAQVMRLAEKMQMGPRDLALYSAYFLSEDEYLLYGDFANSLGRQGMLFRVSGQEVRQHYLWPERYHFDYTNYLQPYFLPRQGICVIANQTLHKFCLYDLQTSQAREEGGAAALGLAAQSARQATGFCC